jgi:diacylglycerol kinase family enzyme
MTTLPPGPRRIVVILNAGSGQGRAEALAERVQRAFVENGAQAEVRLVHGGAEIESALDAAVGESPDVIVAGGGDGTVSAVAAALLDRDILLGVLPLGTLNHFAKDFGLPLEIEAAVSHVVGGEPVRVDVGEVNGRVFVNNSSLGLYPDIVRDRERQQKRLGRGKWLALMRASITALRRYPFMDVRLSVDGQEQLWRTPFVFVGNNTYRMEGFAIGEREGLQDGLLSLYVAQRPGRLRLLLLAMRALLGRLLQARDFSAMNATEVVVESRQHRLRVATDGEVTVMTPPLTYRIRRASLGVMRAGPGAEPA